MSGAVRIGVIGAGNISEQYLTNLTQFPDLDVAFIADLDADRAQAQATKHGVAGHGSVADVLADESIEILVNLTIPAAHVDVALQGLEAGKHVWNEKPIALDRDSGLKLLAAAQDKGLRVATAPDTFLGAGLQSAMRLIADGGIGQANYAMTSMQSPGPESWHPNPDFLFAHGAGPLFDIGPYYLTALVQFFGPITKVQALTNRARTERTIGSGPRAGETFPVEVPTHVSALYEFADGRQAQSTFSFDSPLKRTQFEITGTEATLTVPDPNNFDGDLVVTRPAGDPETIPSVGSTFSRGTGVVELARAIRAGVPERASGELAAHVLDVMQSTIEAGENGGPVQIGSTVNPGAPLPADWDPSEATL